MTLIHILLLVLVLAAFVFAYFSARTWHWGYVLVMLGIFLSTLGFFLLGAETLRINAVLRKQVNDLNRELASVEDRNEALTNGSQDANIISQLQNQEVRLLEKPRGEDPEDQSLASLAELEHRLLLQTRNRGRVWWNVTPTGFDQQTGAVTVNVAWPVPAGVEPQNVVVLFEEGQAQSPAAGAPRGAQYLGQFRVLKSEGQTATLEPVLPLDNFERQRIATSRGPWIMYDTMPVDRYQIFAGMSPEELKQKLPPQSVGEYLHHGQPAGPDDDPARVVGYDENGKRLPPDQVAQAPKKVYQRRPRDYALEFDDLARRRLDLQVDIDATKQDLQRLSAALDSAKKLQGFREDEVQKLKNDLAGVTTERKAIERHLAQVQQYLANGRQRLEETLRRNSEMARQLSARQQAALGGAAAAASEPLALNTLN